MNHCIDCNNELELNSKFCTFCGAKLQTKLSTNENIIFIIGNGLLSIIVGLCIFSIFKLLFSIPLSILAYYELVETDLLEGIGIIVIFSLIGLAIKLTKKLNRSGTKKSRIIIRTFTIILGFIALNITIFFIINDKATARTNENSQLNVTAQPIINDSVTVTNYIEGVVERGELIFDQETLTRLENNRKEFVRKTYFATRTKNSSQSSENFDKTIKFESSSTYTRVNKRKISVVQISVKNESKNTAYVNSVFISGVINNKFNTVLCVNDVGNKIYYLAGKCGQEVNEVFKSL